jgi:hypothetical protein
MRPEARENMPHADDGLLHAYLDGELAGAERDHLLAHLAECAACRTRLEEERALVARAGELLTRAAPPKRAPAPFSVLARPYAPRWRIPAAWAATVTIAFAVGWYAQGERLAHDVAEQATPSETRAPASKSMRAPQRALELAPNPPAAAGPPRQDAHQHQRMIAPTAPASNAAEPAALIDADAARALLGRAPALLPGRPVLRITRSPADNDVVVIEQEWRPGIVLRLYERKAATPGRVTEADRLSSQRARSAPSLAPSAAPALRGENLARYINSLRVEIAGPLASDSLAQLLDSVE